MTEDDLIDAVNQLAASDAKFRSRLEFALGTKSQRLMRDLILEAARALFGMVAEWIRRKAEEWFPGY